MSERSINIHLKKRAARLKREQETRDEADLLKQNQEQEIQVKEKNNTPEQSIQSKKETPNQVNKQFDKIQTSQEFVTTSVKIKKEVKSDATEITQEIEMLPKEKLETQAKAEVQERLIQLIEEPKSQIDNNFEETKVFQDFVIERNTTAIISPLSKIDYSFALVSKRYEYSITLQNYNAPIKVYNGAEELSSNTFFGSNFVQMNSDVMLSRVALFVEQPSPKASVYIYGYNIFIEGYSKALEGQTIEFDSMVIGEFNKNTPHILGKATSYLVTFKNYSSPSQEFIVQENTTILEDSLFLKHYFHNPKYYNDEPASSEYYVSELANNNKQFSLNSFMQENSPTHHVVMLKLSDGISYDFPFVHEEYDDIVDEENEQTSDEVEVNQNFKTPVKEGGGNLGINIEAASLSQITAAKESDFAGPGKVSPNSVMDIFSPPLQERHFDELDAGEAVPATASSSSSSAEADAIGAVEAASEVSDLNQLENAIYPDISKGKKAPNAIFFGNKLFPEITAQHNNKKGIIAHKKEQLIQKNSVDTVLFRENSKSSIFVGKPFSDSSYIKDDVKSPNTVGYSLAQIMEYSEYQSALNKGTKIEIIIPYLLDQIDVRSDLSFWVYIHIKVLEGSTVVSVVHSNDYTYGYNVTPVLTKIKDTLIESKLIAKDDPFYAQIKLQSSGTDKNSCGKDVITYIVQYLAEDDIVEEIIATQKFTVEEVNEVAELAKVEELLIQEELGSLELLYVSRDISDEPSSINPVYRVTEPFQWLLNGCHNLFGRELQGFIMPAMIIQGENIVPALQVDTTPIEVIGGVGGELGVADYQSSHYYESTYESNVEYSPWSMGLLIQSIRSDLMVIDEAISVVKVINDPSKDNVRKLIINSGDLYYIQQGDYEMYLYSHVIYSAIELYEEGYSNVMPKVIKIISPMIIPLAIGYTGIPNDAVNIAFMYYHFYTTSKELGTIQNEIMNGEGMLQFLSDLFPSFIYEFTSDVSQKTNLDNIYNCSQSLNDTGLEMMGLNIEDMN